MKKEKTYWKCIKYNTDKWHGRAHKKNSEVSFHKDNHNHTPMLKKLLLKNILPKRNVKSK